MMRLVHDEVAYLRDKLRWANVQIMVLWGCLAVTWVANIVRAWLNNHGN